MLGITAICGSITLPQGHFKASVVPASAPEMLRLLIVATNCKSN
jgi:hypothetical protein